ncbi:hypothetical protein ACFLS1_04940 [Verrucomicrobiota bacterium]
MINLTTTSLQHSNAPIFQCLSLTIEIGGVGGFFASVVLTAAGGQQQQQPNKSSLALTVRGGGGGGFLPSGGGTNPGSSEPVPTPNTVPAQRVVARNGEITLYILTAFAYLIGILLFYNGFSLFP